MPAREHSPWRSTQDKRSLSMHPGAKNNRPRFSSMRSDYMRASVPAAKTDEPRRHPRPRHPGTRRIQTAGKAAVERRRKSAALIRLQGARRLMRRLARSLSPLQSGRRVGDGVEHVRRVCLDSCGQRGVAVLRGSDRGRFLPAAYATTWTNLRAAGASALDSISASSKIAASGQPLGAIISNKRRRSRQSAQPFSDQPLGGIPERRSRRRDRERAPRTGSIRFMGADGSGTIACASRQ